MLDELRGTPHVVTDMAWREESAVSRLTHRLLFPKDSRLRRLSHFRSPVLSLVWHLTGSLTRPPGGGPEPPCLQGDHPSVTRSPAPWSSARPGDGLAGLLAG